MRRTLRLLVQATGTSSPYKREIAPLRITKDFVLKPLGAPIGVTQPPRPGDNPWQANKATTYLESHKLEREKLTKAYVKSYFRDFRNADHNRGKFYLGNEKLWKKDAALYFPNLRGRTLESGGLKDTTSVVRGKVTVLSMFSRAWAQEQSATFTGDEQHQNPKLRGLIDGSNGVAQHVRINFEEGRLFQMILWMFRSNLRKITPREDWGRYFTLRGIPPEIKDQLGVLNDKVGYCFLLDSQCKIRWSGNGDATADETAALNRGLERLIDETKGLIPKRLAR